MADKLQIMLELERRGALPADKQAILQELRSRGAVPDLASSTTPTLASSGTPTAGAYAPDPEAPSVVNGLKAKTMALVKQAMPWMAEDLGKPADKTATPPQDQFSAETIPALSSAGTLKQGPEAMEPNPPVFFTGPFAPGAFKTKDEENQFLGSELGKFGKDFMDTMPITAGPGYTDKTFPLLKDLLTRQLPNAAKWTAGKIGNFGQFPQRLAGRYLNRPPNSKAVETVWEEGIPLTNKQTANVTKAKADEVWAPAQQLVDEAEAAGKTISRDQLDQAAVYKLFKIADKHVGGIESPEFQKAGTYLDTLGKEPTDIGVGRAENLKQGLGKKIRDWASSSAKDEAQRPVIGVQKAVRRALPDAIAEQTANPDAYLAANEKYGALAKLMNKRGEFSPAERADIYASKRGLYELPRDKAEEALSRILYKMQKAGKNITPKPPEGPGPQNPFDDLMKGGGSGTPPATPGSAAGGWESSSSGMVKDEFGNIIQSGNVRKVHPDWFDGLEPSEAALKAREGQLPSQQPRDQFRAVPDDLEAIFEQQSRPNIPVAEPTPGTLMEGEVPFGSFSQPEGWGTIPEQPSLIHELGIKRPPTVMPDTELYPGTLMEGEVPYKGFQKAVPRGRKGK